MSPQAFPMTQRLEFTVFSTMWISVQITNNGNTNISKTFISFCKLKKNHVSFMKSTWIHLLQIKQTQISTAKFPHLPIPEGGISLPWSWNFPLLTSRTVDMEVSNIHPKYFPKVFTFCPETISVPEIFNQLKTVNCSK